MAELRYPSDNFVGLLIGENRCRQVAVFGSRGPRVRRFADSGAAQRVDKAAVGSSVGCRGEGVDELIKD